MGDLSCTSKVPKKLLAIIKLLRLLVSNALWRVVCKVEGSRLRPFPGKHDLYHELQIWEAVPDGVCSHSTVAVWKRCRVEPLEAPQNQQLAFQDLFIVGQVQISTSATVQ